MNVLALDLATRTGWCHDDLGARQPHSGVERLRTSEEPLWLAVANLIRLLETRIRHNRPDLFAKEAMLPIAAMLKRKNMMENIELQSALHNTAAAIAHLYRIPLVDGSPATIRKHFLGVSSAGDTKSTKLAVVQRCHLLGFLEKCRTDDNQADAIATWDWACHTHGRPVSKELFLFGEK
jgi:hypothetical protein